MRPISKREAWTFIGAIVLGSILLALAGCTNTIAGFGEDMANIGETLSQIDGD